MSHIQLTFVFNLSLLTSIQASAAFNQKKPTVACSLKDENSPFVPIQNQWRFTCDQVCTVQHRREP